MHEKRILRDGAGARGWVGVALVAGLALAGCGGGGENDAADGAGDRAGGTPTADTDVAPDDAEGAAAAEGPVEVPEGDVDALYEAPDPIPDLAPGTLLRHQAVGTTDVGSTLHRIMYVSETVAGERTVVTGVVAVPAGDPPADGWPVLTHGHGSTGLADDCAPSLAFGSADDEGLRTAEQHLVFGHAAEAGFVVASSDYEGQGGPGRHPFLVGVSEGRSMLDAARAAGDLPGVAVDGRLAIAGYSQGGHAALWAREIAAEWAPELDLVGTVAGAPVTQVRRMAAVDDAVGSGAVALTLAAGLAAADPDLDLDGVLTDDGVVALEALDASCEAEPAVASGATMLTVDITADDDWPDRLEANEPGAATGTGPLLAVHSRVDESVPVGDSEVLLDRLCPQGVDVEVRILPEGDHVVAAVEAYDQGVAWLAGLLAGDTPTSGCP